MTNSPKELDKQLLDKAFEFFNDNPSPLQIQDWLAWAFHDIRADERERAIGIVKEIFSDVNEIIAKDSTGMFTRQNSQAALHSANLMQLKLLTSLTPAPNNKD